MWSSLTTTHADQEADEDGLSILDVENAILKTAAVLPGGAA